MGAPDPPATRAIASRSRLKPFTSVLVVGGPIHPADLPRLCDRVRELVEGSDADLLDCDVRALADPDAGTLDVLARLALTARRLGRRIRLGHASSELQELLAFAGLADVVPCAATSAVEPRRQTEEREEPRGVEEERDPADPTG